MSNCTLYGGTPVDRVDFEKEFEKEFAEFEKKYLELKERKKNDDIKNYHFWTIKLNRANKA